jgi:hypothetical protein
MMGGTLGLRSIPNAGSTFTFAVDCDALPAAPPASMLPSDSRRPVSIWNRALVVDDTRLSR